MTNDEIADIFGVTRSTIYEWQKSLEEFSDAIKAGREAATDIVAAAHFKSATGFFIPERKFWYDSEAKTVVREDTLKFYPPDVRAQISWLRNNRPKEWAIDQVEMPPGQHSPQIASTIQFAKFCENAGYPTPFAKQEEMRKFVFDDESNTTRLLLGSRGYGKTEYVTILGTAYQLYLHRDYRVLIITKSDDRNKAIISEIEGALLANGVELEQSTAQFIRVKGLQGVNHSVQAKTVGSSLRGLHPDIVIMDDPVTEEDVSEATRRKLERKYNECVKLVSNIVLIGQPVHVFDLYEKLRPLVKSFEVPHGTIPELDHDIESMILAGVPESSINASYHLKVSSEGGNPLAGVNFIDQYPMSRDSVAFIDPSFKGGDYTAMSIATGYGEGLAVQGFAWKKAWEHCVDDFVDACKTYNIRKLWFECNSLGTMPLTVLRAALKAAGIQVLVTGRDSSTFKHSRIMAAGTFAEMIHLSKKSHQIYKDLTTKYEYGAKFDDPPDSLASLLECIGIIRGKRKK
jgi:hypothetical protein